LVRDALYGAGVGVSDKILFAEKTYRNGAKEPALNVRFAPVSSTGRRNTTSPELSGEAREQFLH
jgi:hypothetical protein